MADIGGLEPKVVEAIREIHDGVYQQGKRDGVTEFLDYLFEHSILLDEYDKAGICYYAQEWKGKQNGADT